MKITIVEKNRCGNILRKAYRVSNVALLLSGSVTVYSSTHNCTQPKKPSDNRSGGVLISVRRFDDQKYSNIFLSFVFSPPVSLLFTCRWISFHLRETSLKPMVHRYSENLTIITNVIGRRRHC